VIVTGHTHDATPHAIEIGNTLLMSSGSHGKYLGRIDLEVKDGKVAGQLQPDPGVLRRDHAGCRNGGQDRRGARALRERDQPRHRPYRSLLYRRGNFNGTWDDLICQGIMEERDTQIALSPGFRWGTTLLPGQDITIDDLYAETSMSYPSVYRLEFTGAQLKDILEDVCDNLFNKDPFYQQGGDMVRVGGMSYTCAPKRTDGQPDFGHAPDQHRRADRSRQDLHRRRLGLGQ
jgi:sulfur-oxidizing protein SoxB